jgi:hypothetical protein
MHKTKTKKNERLKKYLSTKPIFKLSIFSLFLCVFYITMLEIIFSKTNTVSSVALGMVFFSNCYFLSLLSPRYSWVESFFWSLLITVLFLPLVALFFTTILLALMTGF